MDWVVLGLGRDRGTVVGNACIATMAPSAWDLSPVGRTGECRCRDGLGGYHVALALSFSCVLSLNWNIQALAMVC